AVTGATVQVGSRGYVLYSRRLKAGAYYWLRIQDGTLLHSPFFITDGRMISESLSDCGSIQLALADVRWLYQNLPADTPVIMHGAVKSSYNSHSKPLLNDLQFFSYKSEYDQFLKENRLIDD
ncbi:MAG TPA: L,D-transpeptidase, partial [Bacillota bacterium]|nr:L,D-transpeptidase [Bacillota bacterium]